VQVDYTYVQAEGFPEQLLALTATDTLTGLSMSCVVPRKGNDHYAVTQLRAFSTR
jgi:hypothetical protein